MSYLKAVCYILRSDEDARKAYSSIRHHVLSKGYMLYCLGVCSEIFLLIGSYWHIISHLKSKPFSCNISNFRINTPLTSKTTIHKQTLILHGILETKSILDIILILNFTSRIPLSTSSSHI